MTIFPWGTFTNCECVCYVFETMCAFVALLFAAVFSAWSRVQKVMRIAARFEALEASKMTFG